VSHANTGEVRGDRRTVPENDHQRYPGGQPEQRSHEDQPLVEDDEQFADEDEQPAEDGAR
jgi:hypothetical protein